ncbi:hypothetical protein [Streptomyces sp. Z26]|uniref:hypothetical protein n=1 Tax=Streptomyces sp. Z26 TaxID=2500177 RepID=UPI0026D8CEBB
MDEVRYGAGQQAYGLVAPGPGVPGEPGGAPARDGAADAHEENGEGAEAGADGRAHGDEAAGEEPPPGGVPDAPRPLGVGTEPTGHPPVDARLRRLEDADHLAVSGHLEVYEDVHRGLRDTLTALDWPDPGPGPGPALRPDDRPDPRS